MQLFLDAALQFASRLAPRALAFPDPGPFLHEELFLLPVGLEIKGGDDVLADQHGQREIAELALLLRHIGLKAMRIVEEEMRALALDDQGIEGREDMYEP